jgi:hypothetical protein
MTTDAPFVVRSMNFDWHEPIECPTYAEAIAAAKRRGFQAAIRRGGKLVASWCPLHGTQVNDRALAR